MSALGHRNGKTAHPPVRVEATGRMMRVRWTVSLPALLAARGPRPEVAGALEQWGAQAADPSLEWTIEENAGAGTGWAAEATLRGPTAVPLFASNGTTRVQIIEDAASATRHIEVSDNGQVLLSAALDSARGAALYAQTSLLAQLGLAGGRYEVTR